MSIISKSKSYLDNKKAFLAWLETGSTRKAVNHLKTEGIINPETGEPFSAFAVWYSSWCWVLENIEEAKPLFEKERQEKYEEDEWEVFLVKKAMDIYLSRSSKNRFLSWIERMNFERYVYLYKHEVSERFVAEVQP